MHLLFSRPSESIPVWMVMIIFTTTLFVVDDFSRYLILLTCLEFIQEALLVLFISEKKEKVFKGFAEGRSK